MYDGIDDFRLNINAYSLEYGRSKGGTGMVSAKSGGNDLDGTVFEFALGGPIQKNKTFFFPDWQGIRLLTGIARFSTVPANMQEAACSAWRFFSIRLPRNVCRSQITRGGTRVIVADRLDGKPLSE